MKTESLNRALTSQTPPRVPQIAASLMPSPRLPLRGLLAVCVLALSVVAVRASIAYGSINNFDTVNDTGVPAHGFEIELDDLHSTDIAGCYSWNHYGTPSIREDRTSVPGHTNVFVRYAAVKTNGVWSGYTAVPEAQERIRATGAPFLSKPFTTPQLERAVNLVTSR